MPVRVIYINYYTKMILYNYFFYLWLKSGYYIIIKWLFLFNQQLITLWPLSMLLLLSPRLNTCVCFCEILFAQIGVKSVQCQYHIKKQEPLH